MFSDCVCIRIYSGFVSGEERRKAAAAMLEEETASDSSCGARGRRGEV